MFCRNLSLKILLWCNSLDRILIPEHPFLLVTCQRHFKTSITGYKNGSRPLTKIMKFGPDKRVVTERGRDEKKESEESNGRRSTLVKEYTAYDITKFSLGIRPGGAYLFVCLCPSASLPSWIIIFQKYSSNANSLWALKGVLVLP